MEIFYNGKTTPNRKQMIKKLIEEKSKIISKYVKIVDLTSNKGSFT